MRPEVKRGPGRVHSGARDHAMLHRDDSRDPNVLLSAHFDGGAEGLKSH